MNPVSHAKQFARYWLVKAVVRNLEQISNRFPETAGTTNTMRGLAYQLSDQITKHTETTIKPWLTAPTKPRKRRKRKTLC